MEFASRTRETFIELAPGETKSWRLPPCAEGVFNIWVKQINGPAPIGGGSGGGGGHVGGGNAGGIPRVMSHTPGVVSAAGPAGTVARYRAPWGGGLDINDLGEVVLVDDGPGTPGGGMGPAGGLTVDLLRKDAVAKSDPNHIFFKTPNAGDVWSLRIARRADGSTDTRRYRIEVTYPSVLPVERRRIPARFFTRGFQKNWSDNPYLDYLRLISNKIGYRWNARFAEMYGKPQGDQYISLTDSLDLPDVSMSSLTLSVGGEEAPPVYKFPDGMARPIMPYLKLRLEGRCDGSRMLAVNTPGPDFIKVELPEQLSAEVKFFLGTEGSGHLAYMPVVESPLLDMLDRNISYPTPSGVETKNFKQVIKKAIEDQLYKLQRSGTGELVNVVDKYVRPYIVGRYDLIGLEWDAATEDIIVVYVGKQKPRPDHVVVHGHDVPIDVVTGNVLTDGDSQPQPGHVVVHGHDVPIDVLTVNLTSDGDSPAEIPRLFETPEEMPLKPVPVRTVDVTPGNLSKIEHIVVLMQENRSFDHVLGYLSRDGMLPRRNLTRGDESEGRQPPQQDVEGLLPGVNERDVNVFQNHDYRSTRSHTTAWPSYSLPGPYHGADAVTRQVSDRMKDFVIEWARHIPGGTFEEHQLVMNYMTDAELPTYGALTREFAICDHWHCSHLGGTLPNRFISLTGDFSRDSFGSPEVQNPDLLEFAPLEAPTFFDHLTAHGVKWKLFEHGYSMLRLVRNFTFDETNIADFDDEFEAAVAAGLPPVTFIEPDYIETPTGISNDDHAPADMINGQRLIARIMKALLANKEQWAKTLFIITYDEHGGFYDHVEPPTHVETKNPDGSVTQTPIPPLSVGEPRLGVRVPGFVISPWIPGASADGKVNVSHALFDHTSIPATILRRFCGPKAPFMGERWAAANDVGLLLTLDAPRPDSDFDPLRQEMAEISIRPAARLDVAPAAIPKAPMRRPTTQEDLEENFSGLVAFASWIAGRER